MRIAIWGALACGIGALSGGFGVGSASAQDMIVSEQEAAGVPPALPPQPSYEPEPLAQQDSAPPAASADVESQEAEPTRTGRTLNGHTFAPSERLNDPFTTTHFGVTTGLAFASLDAAQIDENGAANGFTTYRLGGLAQSLAIQAGIGEYLALRVNATGQALSGVDLNSALAVGAQVGYVLGGGASFGYTIGSMRVGLSFDVTQSTQYGLNIVSAITNSIMAGRINASTLLNTTNTTTLMPSAQFAIGLHKAVGAWVNVQYQQQLASSGDTSTSTGALVAGAALSLDLHAVSPAPIGFMLSYLMTNAFVDGAKPVHEFGVGVLYSGRRNLSLGVEFDGYSQNLGADSSLLVLTGAFRMRYYW